VGAVNRIVLTVTIVLAGCANAQRPETPAAVDPPRASDPADSDIKRAFDRVDQSVPYESDF